MWKTYCLLKFFVVFCVMSETSAFCNVCQENGAACLDLTSYYPCINEIERNMTEVLTCPIATVCTDLPNICQDAATSTASCGDISTCGMCVTHQVVACTSRTTFSYCLDVSVPSDIVGTCPPHTICDAATQDICVSTDEITDSSIICDRDESDL